MVDEYDRVVPPHHLVGGHGIVLDPAPVVVGPPQEAASLAADPDGRIKRTDGHAAAVDPGVERGPELSLLVPGQQHRGAAGIIVARADAEQAVGVHLGQGVLQPQRVHLHRFAAGGLIGQVHVNQSVLLDPSVGCELQPCALRGSREAHPPVRGFGEPGRSGPVGWTG